MAQTTATATSTKAKNPAAATNGSKGDPTPKPKRQRPVRITHPALKPDADGKATVKLDEYPADWDAKVHKPLRRKDFTGDHVFLERRATELEAKAKQLRIEAEEARKLGNSADRAKAKKLRSMLDKVADLKKELEAQGIDVTSLVSGLSRAEEPAPATV